MDKEKFNEKEILDDKLNGKRFEDLTKEEMDKIQGSGDDVNPEDLGNIMDLLLSKSPYVCRG